jgi:hypothetical protein
MTQRPTLWFVDDLPSNLEKFREKHGRSFDVETFHDPGAVLERIRRKEYPDALLCDLFFFDSVDEGQRAETKVVELAQELNQAAFNSGIDVQTRARGITINDEFKGAPPFPMYAYSSKAPYLFGQQEWQSIYNCGGRVLLKGRVPTDVEEALILTDIKHSKNEQLPAPKSSARIQIVFSALFAALVTILAGKLIRGTW